MLLDTQATYSNAQAFTATGDTASTNSYDHGPGDPGPGLDDIWLVVQTDAAVVSAGGGTVQIVLQDSADNATFADVRVLTGALAVAALGASKTLVRARFPGNLRRYTRVVYRVGTAVLSAGSFSAFVTPNVDNQQYLPSGFTV